MKNKRFKKRKPKMIVIKSNNNNNKIKRPLNIQNQDKVQYSKFKT